MDIGFDELVVVEGNVEGCVMFKIVLMRFLRVVLIKLEDYWGYRVYFMRKLLVKIFKKVGFDLVIVILRKGCDIREVEIFLFEGEVGFVFGLLRKGVMEFFGEEKFEFYLIFNIILN